MPNVGRLLAWARIFSTPRLAIVLVSTVHNGRSSVIKFQSININLILAKRLLERVSLRPMKSFGKYGQLNYRK
jgi:hypothetical protein